jgi:hypothetical protein
VSNVGQAKTKRSHRRIVIEIHVDTVHVHVQGIQLNVGFLCIIREDIF